MKTKVNLATLLISTLSVVIQVTSQECNISLGKDCGVCGVCKTLFPSTTGVCDYTIIEKISAVFEMTQNSRCILKDHCEEGGKCRGSNESGVCYAVFGSHLCECKMGFFGRHCEYKLDTQDNFAARTVASPYAVVKNIVYTPMFYHSGFAEVLVVLRELGTDMRVSLDTGRGETITYNVAKCDTRPDTLRAFCRRLFTGGDTDSRNLTICLGTNSSQRGHFKNCLLHFRIPFPRKNNRRNHFFTSRLVSYRNLGNVEEIKVHISNYVGSSFLKKTVYKQNINILNLYSSTLRSNCVPFVKILNCGENIDHMTPRVSMFNDVMLFSSVRMKTSDPQCTSYLSIINQWKIWRFQVNHDELFDTPLVKVDNSDKYKVEGGSFDYGMYKIKLLVQLEFLTEKLHEIAYCYLKVVQVPSKSAVIGGTRRSLYFKDDLCLEARSLAVPDKFDSSKKQKSLYTWTCNDTLEDFCSPLRTWDDSRTIKGPFKLYKVYKFTLQTKTNVFFGHQHHSESHQEVDIVHNLIPEIYLRCLRNCVNSLFKINPQKKLHLKAFVENEWLFANITYDWYYKIVGESADLIDANSLCADCPPNEFAIKTQNFLQEGKTYLFVVKVNSAAKAEMEATVDFLPQGVSCVANPRVVVIGETLIDIHCNVEASEKHDQTYIYEFLNYDLSPDHARIVGYSTTGVLDRVKLSRDHLVVVAVSCHGTSIVVDVDLQVQQLNETYNQVVNSRRYLTEDLIHQLGLVSAQSDLISDREITVWTEETKTLINYLENEKEDHFLTAYFKENVLFNTVCYRLDAKFQCESILKIAKILFEATKLIEENINNSLKNSRFMNYQRLYQYASNLLKCASLILSARENYDTVDLDTHYCLKSSALMIFGALNKLVNITIVQLTPTYAPFFISDNIQLFVSQVSENALNTMKQDLSIILPNRIKYLKLKKWSDDHVVYYVASMKFKKNPFWWGRGKKVNTNVFILKANYPINGTDIDPVNSDKYVGIKLSTTLFEPMIINGTAKQPHSANSLENDSSIVVFRIIPGSYSRVFIKFRNLTPDNVIRIAISRDLRPDMDFMNVNSTKVSINKDTVTFDTGEVQKDTLFFIGILPGPDVRVRDLTDFSFEFYAARCVVRRYNAWLSGGQCRVNAKTTTAAIGCDCEVYKDIIIGGYLSVPDIHLCKFEDTPLLLEAVANPTMLIVMSLALSVLLVLVFITRRMDRRNVLDTVDVSVLEDNCSSDTHGYLLGVFTGHRLFAGTTSHVAVKLIGNLSCSRTHVLHSTERRILNRSGDDWFLLFTREHLGKVKEIKIWIDFTGGWPNWHCKKVFICDIKTYETSVFFINRWLGISRKGFCLEYIVKCSSLKESYSFQVLLASNTVNNFRELHYWFLFLKHPRSFIKAIESLLAAVCSVVVMIVLLLLSREGLTANLEDRHTYGLTAEYLLRSFLSGIVSNIVGIIIIFNFRKCYKIKEEKFITHPHYHGSEYTDPEEIKCVPKVFKKLLKMYNRTRVMIPLKNKEGIIRIIKNKRKNTFIWITCLMFTIVSCYFILISTLHFSFSKLMALLFHFTSGLIISIFVSLPTLLILLSVLLTLAKERAFDLTTHAIDLSHSFLYKDPVRKARIIRHHTFGLRPYLPYSFWRFKRVIRQQQFMSNCENIAYIVSCFLFIGLVFLMTEQFETARYFYIENSLCQQIGKLPGCEKRYFFMNNVKEFFEDLYKVLPQLYRTDWYNGQRIEEGDESASWIYDAVSRLIGTPSLRQTRVRKNSCKVPDMLAKYIDNCYSHISPENVDTQNYRTAWNEDSLTDIVFTDNPWEFTPGSGAGPRSPSGFTSDKGGYVASFSKDLYDSHIIVKNLMDTNWMDERSRVVIMGFLAYNPSLNVFTSTYIITEIYPTDFAARIYNIKSLRMDENMYVLKGSVFVIGAFLFLFRLLFFLSIRGLNNFVKSGWSMYDLFVCLAAIAVSIQFAVLVYTLKEYRSQIEGNEKDRFFYLEIVLSKISTSRKGVGLLFLLVGCRFLKIFNHKDEFWQYFQSLGKIKVDIFWAACLYLFGLCVFFFLVINFLAIPIVTGPLDIFIYRTNFDTLKDKYKDPIGKIFSAFIMFFTTSSVYTVFISLIHSFKSVEVRRLSKRLTVFDKSEIGF